MQYLLRGTSWCRAVAALLAAASITLAAGESLAQCGPHCGPRCFFGHRQAAQPEAEPSTLQPRSRFFPVPTRPVFEPDYSRMPLAPRYGDLGSPLPAPKQQTPRGAPPRRPAPRLHPADPPRLRPMEEDANLSEGTRVEENTEQSILRLPPPSDAPPMEPVPAEAAPVEAAVDPSPLPEASTWLFDELGRLPAVAPTTYVEPVNSHLRSVLRR